MYIKATVTAGSTKDSVTVRNDRYYISTKEKAANGRATQAARSLLADHLGVPPSSLSLLRGATKPSKLFLLRE
jgi:uncharacterized protein YggU (UPF0235/DUF167 family)